MTNIQQEAFAAVQTINQELFEKYDKTNQLELKPTLSIIFAERMTFISISLASETLDLPEIHLYNSENDKRIFYSESNEYESFYVFIKRMFEEIKEKIYSIKL